MFRRITTLVLLLALIVTGFWGYREHKQKQALLLKSENQYQRAFHDLSDHMNSLQDELGKSLAINSKLQRSSSLSEAWRLAGEARNDVGELPLSLMPFNNTMNFLNDIGNFSYKVAVHDQDMKALDDNEWKTLQTLYTRSKGLENQLAELQAAVINKNLRWMDAETALAETHKKTDNQILDGFRSMEKKIKDEKPISFGPTVNSLKTRNAPDVNQLTGKNVSAEQAATIAQQWLNLPSTKDIKVMKNGDGNNYPSYSVIAKNKAGQSVYISMTVKGGHITSVMDNRTVTTESLDLSQAEPYAVRYLHAHGIDPGNVVNIDSYDSVGVYEYVPVQNGVLLYPDKVTVKVALDNGEVVGLNSQDYAFHHKPRTIPQAKLTEAQARKYVSPKVQIKETNLAIVLNELKNDALVYEFIGTMDNDTYKVYISAIDGKEVGVEKLK